MQKNNFFDIFNFLEEQKTSLYTFESVHFSHLLILRIKFLLINVTSSTTIVKC